MDDIEDLSEPAHKFKNSALIIIESWGGLGDDSGTSGTVVLKNGEVYEYNINFNAHKSLLFAHNDEAKLLGKLFRQGVLEIENFLDDEKIMTTNYIDGDLEDLSETVYVNYKGAHRKIVNGYLTGPESVSIYQKVSDMLDLLIGRDSEEY